MRKGKARRENDRQIGHELTRPSGLNLPARSSTYPKYLCGVKYIVIQMTTDELISTTKAIGIALVMIAAIVAITLDAWPTGISLAVVAILTSILCYA
jgi:hypothetical protein